MATIKQFRHGAAESISLSKSDEKAQKEESPTYRKKKGNVMAEIKKELYGIPKHLDVDKSKFN